MGGSRWVTSELSSHGFRNWQQLLFPAGTLVNIFDFSRIWGSPSWYLDWCVQNKVWIFHGTPGSVCFCSEAVGQMWASAYTFEFVVIHLNYGRKNSEIEKSKKCINHLCTYPTAHISRTIQFWAQMHETCRGPDRKRVDIRGKKNLTVRSCCGSCCNLGNRERQWWGKEEENAAAQFSGALFCCLCQIIASVQIENEINKQRVDSQGVHVDHQSAGLQRPAGKLC